MTSETALPAARRFFSGRSVVIAVKVAVTLACFWYLYRHIDIAELRRTLPGFDVRWAVLAVVLMAAQIPLVALRWREIVSVLEMPGGAPGYGWMCAVSAVGQFFGQVLPMVAGDGIRVWLLADRGGAWGDATISVMVDRCVGVGLLFAFAFVILLLPASLGLLAGYWAEVVATLALLLAVGALAVLFGPRVGPLLARWRHAGWIARFFEASRLAVLGPRAPAILTAGCLIHLLTIAAVWSLGRAQGAALPPIDAAVLFAVMVGVTLVPFSVGGWGLREFAMVSLFGNYGLTPERALVFSMYFGLVTVVAALPGAGVWFGYLLRRTEPSSKPG